MKGRLAACIFVVAVVVPRAASAAVKVWDGGGADANWTTKENWVGDVAPEPYVDILEFPDGAARKSNVNNFPAGTLFIGIHFSGAVGGYVLSGNQVLLRGPVTTSNTGGTNTINFSIDASTDASLRVVYPSGLLAVGPVNLLSDLALTGAGTIMMPGLVTGPAGMTIAGTGITSLTAANTYTGATTVFDGTLLVYGLQSSSSITMVGGSLFGPGGVGALGAYSGTVSPGVNAGVLNARDTTMTQETTFRVDLNGPFPGTNYDQLNVIGEVHLGGATLNPSLGFLPTNGLAHYRIINNDGNDAVVGTFAGLPEGAQVAIGGLTFTISYMGGTGNDVVLTLGAAGFIGGTVTSAMTGAPVAGVPIDIYSSTGVFVTATSTNSQGEYLSPVLPTGSYFVKAPVAAPSSSGLLGQLYNNLPCPSGACIVTSGTPVAVTLNGAPHINFALPTGASITGTVTSETTGAPVPNVRVSIYGPVGLTGMAQATTNAQGVYTLLGLPTGTYYVVALPPDSSGLLGQLHRNVPCFNGTCNIFTGTPVALTAPNATTVNFALKTGATITGTVTNASTGAPVPAVSLWYYNNLGQSIFFAQTNAQGVYVTKGLPTGSYFLTALPPSTSGLTGQLHNNLPCPSGGCIVTTGTPIALTAPTATTVNFALTTGGRITGTLTNAATSAPVASETVDFYTSTGVHIGSVFTNAQGFYTSPALPTGTYYVQANPSRRQDGLLAQMYDGVPCHAKSCSVLSGTPVSVTAPGTTPTINFSLVKSPAAPNDTFANAVVIDSVPFQSIVNTYAGTMGAEDPVVSCASFLQASVWYVFTPSVTGPLEVNTLGSTYETALAIYTGAPGNFTSIGCDRAPQQGWPFKSTLRIQGVAGQRLAILVASSGGPGGVLVLNVTGVPGPFGKISPASDATTWPSGVTLSWGPSAYAQTYEYCIDTIANGLCESTWVSAGTATSVHLEGLAPNTRYYWQVRAVSGEATTYAEGDAMSFWRFTPRLPLLYLDNDTRSDVFVYSTAGLWRAHRTQEVDHYVSDVNTGPPGWSWIPAIFDADQRTDVLRFNVVTGQWSKMLTDGPGFINQASGNWWPGWQRYVIDLNGDGLSDFFLYDPATGAWFKAFSTPDGFTYEQGAWSPGWEIYPMLLNDDAFGDLFLFNRTTGQWYWAVGADAPGFSYPVTDTWLPEWQLHTGDFNGDGLGDVFLLKPEAGEYYVAFNNRAGYNYVRGWGWAAGWTPAVADFNADGKDDLFLHNSSTGAWFQMIGDGAGNFTAFSGQSWPPGLSVYPGDFNGDGRADLLLYNTTTGVWYQARNLGNGAFFYTSGTWVPGLTVVTRGPLR